MAGWDAEPERDWCQFSSPVRRDGDSAGDEKEVEDAEDVRLEVSSAPEDVTSWKGLERQSDGGSCCSWGKSPEDRP